MKNWSQSLRFPLLSLLMIAATGVLPVQAASSASPQVRLHHSAQYEIKQLQREIHQLRQQLWQLESRLMRLSEQDSFRPVQPPQVKPLTWGCYLHSTFKGTFFASANTEAEAIGRVLQQCQKKGAHFCKPESVKCSASQTQEYELHQSQPPSIHRESK